MRMHARYMVSGTGGGRVIVSAGCPGNWVLVLLLPPPRRIVKITGLQKEAANSSLWVLGNVRRVVKYPCLGPVVEEVEGGAIGQGLQNQLPWVSSWRYSAGRNHMPSQKSLKCH